MTVLTIDRELQKVNEAVERVRNDAEQHFSPAASVGDAVRQGDIYIQKIDDVTSPPALYKKLDKPAYPLQLAPGNTKGSRHMLEADETAVVYNLMLEDETGDWETDRKAAKEFDAALTNYAMAQIDEPPKMAGQWNSATQHVVNDIREALNFCGPIFRLTKEAKISHPEHGDWLLPPGSYRITFQRTVDAEDRIRRVLD